MRGSYPKTGPREGPKSSSHMTTVCVCVCVQVYVAHTPTPLTDIVGPPLVLDGGDNGERVEQMQQEGGIPPDPPSTGVESNLSYMGDQYMETQSSLGGMPQGVCVCVCVCVCACVHISVDTFGLYLPSS